MIKRKVVGNLSVDLYFKFQAPISLRYGDTSILVIYIQQGTEKYFLQICNNSVNPEFLGPKI